MSPLTLEDIAEKSGVSRSTVSRVINGDPNVSEKTRQRVMDIVSQVNFQPNLAARGMAGGHTQVLGLVIPMGVSAIFTDPFFPTLIQSVSSACNAKDYSVMLWLAEPEYERRTITKIMYTGLVDGVIVSSSLKNDSIVEALANGKLPFVLIGRHLTNNRINYVDVDNIDGARKAVLHLSRCAGNRIAHIAGPQNMVVGLDRFEGYKAGLRERDIPFEPDLVVEGDFTERSGYDAMQRLLPLKPDAVFAASDAMAFGAFNALRDAGLRVPEDIGLVGFDDVPDTVRAYPALTTVRQPIQQMATVAADMLIDLIENPVSEPQHIILPTELIVRQSCAKD